MVNPFPHLLIYGIFAPTLIRVALGAALLFISVEHFRSRKSITELTSPLMGRSARLAGALLAFVEIVVGGLLVVGAWTQIAALLVILLSIKALFIRKSLHALLPVSRGAYVLIAAMALSLLLSGAGGYAFDLPL